MQAKGWCKVDIVRSTFVDCDLLQFNWSKLSSGKPQFELPFKRVIIRLVFDGSVPAMESGQLIHVEGLITYSLRRGHSYLPTILVKDWGVVTDEQVKSHLFAAKI
jgi:hypothetical protein